MSNEDIKLMTRDEVAAEFGISKRYLEIAAGKGGGPAMVKIGRSVRYTAADVRAWIDASRVSDDDV